MEHRIKHILETFKGLERNDIEHTYSFNSKPISISVSNLIKRFYKPFDKQRISKAVANFEGVSQEYILKEWDNKNKKSIKLGNKVHLFGEVYPFNRELKPTNKHEEAIVKFWNDLPSYIIPVICELKMFHKQYLFAGTTDLLLYNTLKDTYIIGDYKSNENIFKNYKGKKMTGVFKDLLDCNFNKYQLQLSYYQILFEQTGLKVDKRKLIWLLPNGEYFMYDTKDYTDLLLKDLELNKIN